MLSKMLSVKEVAKLLNVSEKKVYRMIAQNEVPVNKVGEEYQFNRVELLEWATSMGIHVSTESIVATPEAESPLFIDALREGSIAYNVPGNDKVTVLKNVVKLLKLPANVDPEFMYEIIIAREKLGSTGIGDGIAIPHVRNPVILNVNKPVVTLSFLEKPIDFESIDGKPVNVLFTIISPTIRVHLHLLSRLGYVLQNPAFKSVIKDQAKPDLIFAALQKAEAAINVSNSNQSDTIK
ncbi:MAG: PTS sugar transporter subunit IIA [Fibrobacterota bacterium]